MTDLSVIIQTVHRQRSYFEAGTTRDIEFRIKALRKLEAYIKSHDEDIMAALKVDLGKARFEAYATEVGVVLDELRYALRHIRSWNRPKRVRSNFKNLPSVARIHPEPYGVALILSPWNYPFMLTVVPLIAAVAAGNCAVVKPSAYAPASSAMIAKMCAELFDAAHVAVIEGGRRENEALLEQRYDVIFFTGSATVGRTVLQAAARDLTPTVLELGGKSPCIVDATTNLKITARRIAWGKYVNAGQTCVAPDYLLVHASVKDELVARIKEATRVLFGGQPLENADYSKIINNKHFDRLMSLMEGQTVVYGGRADPVSLKIEPTILDDVSWDAPIMQEEIFGPILPVLTYDSLEEAVSLINSRPKPLALYLFTAKREVERYFLDRVSFGGGCLNDTVVHLSAPSLPFGGVGASGFGSYHGKAGFDAFTHYRSILSKSKFIDIPVRYPPYTESKLKFLKRL